jgi:outer membrane autotransporter protein
VFGGIRDVDGSAAITGYQSSFAGLAAGYEAVTEQEGSRTVLGFAASYGQTDLDIGPSSAGIDTYSVGVYGSYEQNNWRASGALTYGMQDYDIDRVIPIGAGFATANGQADGTVFAASAKLAYDIAPSMGLSARNSTRLAPYVQLDHVSVDRDGFTETGAGVLNLAVGSDSFSQSSVSLGIETSAENRNPGGTVTRPYFDIHWEHVFDGRSATSNSFVAGTPAAAFATAGAFEDRDRLGIGAGMRIDMSNNSSIDLSYEGTFANGYTDHAGSFEFRIAF